MKTLENYSHRIYNRIYIYISGGRLNCTWKERPSVLEEEDIVVGIISRVIKREERKEKKEKGNGKRA